MWCARRPGPVFNCNQERELRFVLETTAWNAFKIFPKGNYVKFLSCRVTCAKISKIAE